MITFKAGRRRAKGYLVVPEGGDVPGILVIHAWWGLTDFFKSVCDRLADEGFVALAPDLYHGRTASTIEEAKHLKSMLKRDVAAEELRGAASHLSRLFATNGEKIGAMGFSLGAYWALWLSTQTPTEVAAAVPFYGIRNGDYKKTRAAFLGHFAETDKWAPLISVRKLEKQMRFAGREVTFHIYPGTKHWFFEEDRPDAYNPRAARQAWKRTVNFLHRRL